MPEQLHVVCPHCNTTNRIPKERLRSGGKCGACHKPLFEGRPVTLDDPARFAKQAEVSDIPLLVDFSAGWCAPCQAMTPIFEEVAPELEPDVRLVKVDVDQSPAIAAAYAIRGVPTLVLLSHERELARTSGLMPRAKLLEWTRQHLAQAAAS
jgi:thioredoxin 2